MVDSLDEEERNRLVDEYDLKDVESEQEFWEQFNYMFRRKAHTKLGKVLLGHIEYKYGDLPKRPKVKRIYYYKGIKFQRQVIYRKHRHYTVNRDIKTGRFISLN